MIMHILSVIVHVFISVFNVRSHFGCDNCTKMILKRKRKLTGNKKKM